LEWGRVFSFLVLEIQPRASHMLGKCFTAELHPRPHIYFNALLALNLTSKRFFMFHPFDLPHLFFSASFTTQKDVLDPFLFPNLGISHFFKELWLLTGKTSI
jgi:hypothetical protein